MKQVEPKHLQLAALLTFFAGGVLGLFKPASDYTLIKNVMGYVFCLLTAIAFIFEKRTFSFSRVGLISFIVMAIWYLYAALTAPCGYAAAGSLELFLLYFLIFLLAAQYQPEKTWVYFWLGSAFIAVVIALVQDAMPSHYGISTFGNPNFFAGHMLIPLLLATSMLRQKKLPPPEITFLILFLVCGLTALFLSRSRAAIAGFFFGLACFAFFVFPKKGKSAWKAYGGLACFGIITYLMWPMIQKWFLSNIRYYIWKGTWRMVTVKPVLGWGLGNFQIYYPWYRFREYFRQAESTPVTNNPHNHYLEIWCETGLVGLLIFLGFIILLLWLTQRISQSQETYLVSDSMAGSRKRNKQPDKAKGRDSVIAETFSIDQIVSTGLAAGVAAVLADNLFSTNLSNASTAMFFWFSLGILAGTRGKNYLASLSFSKYLWVVIAISSYIMAVFVSYYRITSQVYLKRGIWAKEARQYKAAISYYTIACQICPSDYVTWYKLAYVYGETGQLAEAKKIYLHINNFLFPHFAKTDMNLGTIALKQGNISEALFYYRWAEWINPY
ncbi:MAG: O-antigen ligase family protein, partial [Candidatus Omnitrophica bacterium]|nr:O-antigen ligase family protein [Candidatus Omnitrophota bacterium]